MIARNRGPARRRAGSARITIEERRADGTLVTAAVDLLALCESSSDIDELVAGFHGLLRPLGFEHAAMLDMARENPADAIRFTTFRPEWLVGYVRDRAFADDPVWRCSLVGTCPFLWSAAVAKAGREPGEDAVFYRSVGLSDGMTVPFALPQMGRGAFFLGAVRPLAIEVQARAVLHLTCGVLAARILALAPARPPRRLTGREREVLTLTAHGQSAREIGQLLQFSEKTVARHLLNIRGKLDAANTVHAVVIARRENLIMV